MDFEKRFKTRIRQIKEFRIPLPQNVDEFKMYCYELYKSNAKRAVSVYLEIGSRHGASLYVAAGFLPTFSRVICIDLPNASWGAENSETKLADICKKLVAEGYRSKLLLGDSRDARIIRRLKSTLNGALVDAMFFDGDHTFEGICSDWNNYAPLLKSNGIIGFHDIRKNSHHQKVEVHRLWNKLKEKRQHIEVIFKHGIGILWMNALK